MQNNSGIYPTEYKVLLKPDPIQDKTEGGLFIPDAVKDSDKWSQMKGTLVAIGGNAFEGWKEPIPTAGQHIMFSKYAGASVKGADDEEYRLANDKDVAAILEN